ncbi:bifunctional tetrahydrofolate synthase/dihydrofolate synthase [Thiorhodococcus mannitoliphagus]|uniref:Dihydrofolate synthase/folylpolyglutamate synthase n=1 Tax=Thiorhodococcus mannitoliphagus TaxID=329406 RepID=A0A6P1DR66_9GAMM|nr:bifunctional tetrahydrofolate synthase/dihydrofolate synthase [Thiorhodococcus mannitoliphagus]NEX20538.1 bifunctional tetrahydrofolate synthase/dihydrofolate synthase [Thiorhodococcus mannitoliphagus]
MRAGPVGLQAWLEWQLCIHPQHTALGLERVSQVWRRLRPEPLGFPVITVGGTNGKGSCVAMIEAMALAAGYRCGSYSSPHLVDYNERVKLAGKPVSDEVLCSAFERVEAAREAVALTYFEFGTVAALDIFAREQPDLVVLEVGLGGRLDAVNISDSDVSVVTSIGLDHTAWLGESLDAIAREKAGIFRPGRPAIIGQRDAPAALRQAAEDACAQPIQLGREMVVESADAGWILRGLGGRRLALPLPAMRGGFQLDNAASAITALQCLAERLPISAAALRAGLGRALLPGRFQIVPGEVTWILDVAHNAEAAGALAANLSGFRCDGSLRAVLAVLGDKLPEAIVEPLRPFVADWYLAQSDDARAMPVDELGQRLESLLGRSIAGGFLGVDSAIEHALAASRPGDCLLVVGSFTTVGQALRRAGGI